MPGQEKDFLKDIVLLRNDPALVGEIRDKALQGNTHAQYALGLVYAEGRGVDEDLIEAWAWLTLAVMRGDRDAEQLRFVVSGQMRQDQFAEAEQRAAQYEAQMSASHSHQ
ncbi:MAG: sel1 repeat family protein [Granulosicoccaceae bacterium]|jgi:TPR repeat protein